MLLCVNYNGINLQLLFTVGLGYSLNLTFTTNEMVFLHKCSAMMKSVETVLKIIPYKEFVLAEHNSLKK